MSKKIINTVEEWLGKDNKLGIDIWHKKYQQDNETFIEWLDRVSGGDTVLKELILEKKFLFGGRILSNRGLNKKGKKVTYSNCYVISPPEDNIESIFETASKLARTFSYGGGCGIDISKLSPRGAKINNTAKETTGSVSFMELYNLITSLIGQNGRRGALMLSIDCNHPDLEEFISVKNDLNSITKANISVRVDDAFMTAVVEQKPVHELIFVRNETGEEIRKIVNPNVIFRQLCENNWDFAEPGILFWDRIKGHNLLSNDDSFEYAGVNPCAEEPLPAGGSCLLGSINLAAFVGDEGIFNIADFKYTVRMAVNALNDVLDEGLSLHPLEEQRKSVGDWRQIGLGIFGLADMLIKLGIPYGSDASLKLCDNIAFAMVNEAIFASALLAKDNGTYPMYKDELINKNPFLLMNTTPEVRDIVDVYGLRNSQLLTIAPTGSISTMLGVSGGIEPIFDTHYVRKTESLHNEDKYYVVYTPIVEEYMKKHDIKDVAELPSHFKTAKTINPMDRILMQGVWQDHIDASISSTINLPEHTTVEDVIALYSEAWNAGLKGLTIFRENCARIGVLTSEPKKEEPVEIEKKEDIKLDTVSPLTRNQLGDCLSGSTYVREIACGKLYITINRDENNNLVEVFIDSGKSGGCSANTECLGRYASACMRAGMKIEDIIDVTKGVKCSACTKVKGANIKKIDGLSCGDVVAKTIKEEYDKYHGCNYQCETCNKCAKDSLLTMKKEEKQEKTDSDWRENVITSFKRVFMTCPECGEEIVNEGGCVICKNCGHSKCD